MKYVIDKNTGVSAYMQIYGLIKSDIINEIYKFGSKLPSKRLLAEETGVSIITVEHAYALLTDEGYIEPREKSGYFVAFRESDFNISDHNSVIHTVVPEKPALSGYAVSFSELSRIMRKVILDRGEMLLVKSPNKGCLELRTAISDYLKRSSGITADPGQIVIGAGAEYLYGLIVQLLGKDLVYATEDPCYEKIQKVYLANGINLEKLKLSKGGIPSETLENSSARVLHVTPFNSYPSGITASAAKIREYLRWAKKRDGYIIEDNYDSELTVSQKYEESIFSISDNTGVIYINTFSKTISPSIRAGYMILPSSLLNKFERDLGFYSCTVPVFEQYLISELITSGEYERHINRVRRAKRKLLKK